jgi:hypothetical protein
MGPWFARTANACDRFQLSPWVTISEHIQNIHTGIVSGQGHKLIPVIIVRVGEELFIERLCFKKGFSQLAVSIHRKMFFTAI